MYNSFQNTMKHIASATIVVLLLASCGGTDKPAQLAKLKADYAAMAEQIKALEAEIAATDTTTKAVKVKDVIITNVQPTTFRHFIDIQGNVDAEENVVVQPLQPGKVIRINVSEGEQVQKGKVLAELEHDILDKQLATLQPQLALATENHERLKRLWEQKIGSEINYMQAKTQKETLERNIDALKEQIELSIIVAPISGSVDHIGLKLGQVASPMTMDPAFRIVNLSKLKVKAKVAEGYSTQIKNGNKVKLHFPDLNTSTDATISHVERVIDPLTRTFGAEVNLNSDNGQYRPNQVAILKIVDYENPAVIVLPINSVQSNGIESFVYVAENNGGNIVARKRVVTIGQIYNGQAEILSGLNANDNVVTTGQFDLSDGANIKF
jgi:membrane fusion protein (multidrug efflux system)